MDQRGDDYRETVALEGFEPADIRLSFSQDATEFRYTDIERHLVLRYCRTSTRLADGSTLFAFAGSRAATSDELDSAKIALMNVP